VNQSFTGKLGQCNAFMNGCNNHIVHDWWLLGGVVPSSVIIVEHGIEMVGDHIELVKL
jgi:hypothetical protein